MRKSDIERQLKNELNQATPTAFDKLWEKCENTSEEGNEELVFEMETVAVGVGGNGTRKAVGKRWVALFGVFLMAVLAIVAVWGIASGWFYKGDTPSNPPTITRGYFVIDVNPSVEIGYEENGCVSEVVGLNTDGKALVYGIENEFVGEPYENVISALFDRCVRLGYFSATSQTNAVLVSATKQSGGSDAEMAENARKIFLDKFVEKRLCGVALAGKDNPELAQEATAYGIDAQKYALIKEYLTQADKLGVESEIAQEDYAKISIRGIYEKMEALQEVKIGETASDTMAEKLEDLKEELRGHIDGNAFEEMEELVKTLEDAKTFEEIATLAQPIKDKLKHLSDGLPPHKKEKVGLIQTEIDGLLAEVETDKEKLQKTPEDLYNERSEKYKEDFDKEAEEPKGGFKGWQDEHKQHFEEDWHGKKEEWKDRFHD